MDANWDDLKYLLAVTDAGTLSGAAAALNSNPTTVSRRLRRLESEFGFPLLERSGDGWRPTPMSKSLVDTARRMRLAMNAAEHAVARQSTVLTGSLLISTLPFVNAVRLVALAGAFIARHPGLDLSIDDSAKPQSLAMGEADISLTTTEPVEGRLVKRRMATFRIGIYRRNGETTNGRWLGLNPHFDQTKVMQLGYRHMGGKPVVRLPSLMNLGLAMRATGLPGALPSCVARQYPDLELAIDPEDCDENGLWLVYHESKRGDPRIEKCVEWLGEVFPNSRRCICGRCN